MKKLTIIVLFGFTLFSVACASKSKQVAKPADTKAAAAKPAATTGKESTKAQKSSSKSSAKSAAKKGASTAAAAPATAAEVTKDGITIVKSVACKSIENRNPVGEGDTFPSSVGRIYLFTQLKTAGNTTIQHIWHHDGKKVAEVTLPVNGTSWRTYSTKSIDASSKGEWQVDVTTSKGDIIETTKFKVE